MKRNNSVGRTVGLPRTRTASGQLTALESSSGGGLSVTGCLADFSLYIFHPYGGGQKKTTLSALENSFRRGTHGMYANKNDDVTVFSPGPKLIKALKGHWALTCGAHLGQLRGGGCNYFY